MKTKEEIEQAANEFAKRCDPLNQTLEKQADVRLGFKAGAEFANPKWIKCSDRLPEVGQIVLSYSLNEGIRQTKYTTYQKGSIGFNEGIKDFWFEWITHNGYAWKHNATHWMDLPQMPEL